MKSGTVWQRHGRSCPAAVDGRRPAHRCRGPWAYVVDLGVDTTGKRRQTTKSGFPTKAAAVASLRELSSVLTTDVSVTSTTVSDYLDVWLASKHALRPSTRIAYASLIQNYLRPRLGDIRLLDLRAHHLDRFYAAIAVGARGRPLSSGTLHRVHAVLRSALNSAVKRRLIPYSPADHVELAAENPKRPKPWTATQCLDFLAAIRTDRLYALYRLYLFAGLRRGEGAGLRWSSLDLDEGLMQVSEQHVELRGKVTVGEPKTKRGVRAVALDPTMVQVLREHRSSQEAERAAWHQRFDENGLVFTREDGSPLRPEYVTRHFQDLARRNGLPVVRLHDLRHASASLALKAGVAMKVVSDRLGHSSIAITANLYTHVYDDVARDGAELLAAVLTDRRVADVSDLLAQRASEEDS